MSLDSQILPRPSQRSRQTVSGGNRIQLVRQATSQVHCLCCFRPAFVLEVIHGVCRDLLWTLEMDKVRTSYLSVSAATGISVSLLRPQMLARPTDSTTESRFHHTSTQAFYAYRNLFYWLIYHFDMLESERIDGPTTLLHPVRPPNPGPYK